MKLHGNRHLAALAAGALALAAAGCGAQGTSASAGTDPGSNEVVINQAFQSLLYLPLYVAQEQGYFEDEGVDVTIDTGGGGTQSWSAVLGGSADFSIQDPVFVPKSHEQGGEGVVVAAVQNAPTVFIIGQDDTDLQDDLSFLDGKRVVTSPEPDTTWAFMTYLAQQNDIDVEIVNVAIGNELAAVQSGQADYALAVDPQVAQGEAMGLTSVYSFSANEDWSPFAFSSLTTTQAYIDENPEAAQGVVTAFERASRSIYADPDRAIEIAQEYFSDLDDDVIATSVNREIEAKGYPETVLVTPESWDNNLEIALYAGNVEDYPSDATSYETNVNTELAEQAATAADEAGTE
ncbi:ABC transporter substrate-binding protein [Promicromonospora sp. NPDC050262]|uniref:ABC transporter substrate-binding protein n=1 Tax=Promicromonospora sp. NPDC050262 TaxID=3155036 RepID=UPI003400FBB8